MFSFGKKNLKTEKKEVIENIYVYINNFNESAYLEANPDVQLGIEKGDFQDVKHHLETFGIDEIKQGTRKYHSDLKVYKESDYLKVFSEAINDVEDGETFSVFAHFCNFGYDIILNNLNSDENKYKIFQEKKDNTIDIVKNEIKLVDDNIDTQWYAKQYNIDINVINSAEHFYKYGYKEGKSPTKNFDLQWYLNEYQDIHLSEINPFLHYLQLGKNEGRYQNSREKDIDILNQEIHSTFSANRKESTMDISSNEIISKDEKFFIYLYDQKRGNLNTIKIKENTVVVSLDIWDTVLRRKCHPDEIKYSAARYLYLNYLWKLKPAMRDINTLFTIRLKNENMVSLTNDYEFRYDDAINGWLVQVFERGTLVSTFEKVKHELLEHELSAELRSTEKDYAIDSFLSKLKHPQIIFASDFYMSNSFIKKLLKKNGVAHHFIKGYVSCDLVKNKRSGELFEHIKEEFQVASDEIFHIGDNIKADIDIPKGKGIQTFHYFDEHEMRLHQWFEDAFIEKQNKESKLHSERIYSLCKILSKKKKMNTLENIGSKLAPIVIGYILHIIEEAKRFDVNTIYFFTREGVFLKEVYDLVVKADPYYSNYPKSELLEVSRLATFAPSLEGINSKSLMRLWNQYSTQSPKAFCSSLNIDMKESKAIFEDFGFDYNENIKYPWENSEFIKLLDSQEFKTIVDEHIGLQKKNIKKYLKDKGLNSGQSVSMIVDLGWRGTIQDNVSYLVDEHIHGCYLGLFNYLNKQEKVSKSGWMFDNNTIENDWENHEVGPLEMLFNSLGGSTTGYKEVNTQIKAIKKSEISEDAVYNKYTVHFQDGIKNVLTEIIDYVAIHGLDSSDFREISRKISKSMLLEPISEFSEAFFNLTHNEKFGTGEYQKMEVDSTFISNLSKKSGSALHSFVKDNLDNIRWKNGFLSINSIIQSIQNIDSDLTNTPLEFHSKIFLKDKINNFKVAIYSPAPIEGSGGHRTLFNLARKFVEAGCEVFCFIEELGSGVDTVYDYLGDKRAHVYVGWPENIPLDMAVATIAHSSEFVQKLKNVKHKAYLVQDFEAWFNPVGDTYTTNENSYTFGNLHLTVGNFLTHLLHSQYGAKSIPSGLGIDTNIYFDKEENREDAIAFLYQPEKFRRNPELAINALRIVKQKNPKIKIYVYGSDADIDLDFEIENLGLIRDLKDLNNLYNNCKVGLCISMTNPSRIPFEFMASGVVAVDVYRYNNLIDYPTGTIKLAYQSSESIAEAILQVIEDKKEYELRKRVGIKFATTRTLDWEMDTFVNNALKIMNDMSIDSFDVGCDYEENPVISIEDDRKEVKAFCNWQKKLATNKISKVK